MRSARLVAPLIVCAVGCGKPSGPPSEGEPATVATLAPSAPEAASVAAPQEASPPASARPADLRVVELERRTEGILPSDLAARSVEIRRAAARALARLRSAGARERLLVLLADEDAEVVGWAAYGLGDLCTASRDATVGALVARAATLRAAGGLAASAVSPLGAIARALGRCGTEPAERTLVAWARAREVGSDDAVLGLADVAAQRRLREDTCVSLLELASGTARDKPWAFALAPYARATNLPASVLERTREVATARLADAGDERIFAIRALGRTEERAVEALVAVARAPDRYGATERVEAVRALARLGGPGQRGLRQVASALLPEPHDAASITGAGFGVTLAAVEALTDVAGARGLLDRYTKLEVSGETPPTVARRLSQLRCAAARLVAERDFDYAPLVYCDRSAPKGEGRTGALARVAAVGIEGTQLTEKRWKAWQVLAASADPVVRAAAVRLLADHPEAEEPDRALLAALESKQAGVVAAAAEVIASHPDRVRGKEDDEPKRRGGKARAGRSLVPAVGKALTAQLEVAGADVEVLVAVVDAVGALAIDGAKPALEALCGSSHALVRQRAEHALATILGGAGKVACAAPKGAPPSLVELSHLEAGPLVVAFDSDVGELRLELDPRFAPVAVTRLVDLVRTGFYDGMLVHRVVPGFVTQLGSPSADGYGGAPDRPPLPCETSPLRFRPGSVGVALAGRDTGSSQFFVTHSDQPHLDGQYAWLGSSRGPWDALAVGDRIVKARVVR